jgi:hypothetical protein
MLGESENVSLFLTNVQINTSEVISRVLAAQNAIGAASLLAVNDKFKACANAFLLRNGHGVTFDEASGVYHYIGSIGGTLVSSEALIHSGCYIGAEPSGASERYYSEESESHYSEESESPTCEESEPPSFSSKESEPHSSGVSEPHSAGVSEPQSSGVNEPVPGQLLPSFKPNDLALLHKTRAAGLQRAIIYLILTVKPGGQYPASAEVPAGNMPGTPGTPGGFNEAVAANIRNYISTLATLEKLVGANATYLTNGWGILKVSNGALVHDSKLLGDRIVLVLVGIDSAAYISVGGAGLVSRLALLLSLEATNPLFQVTCRDSDGSAESRLNETIRAYSAAEAYFAILIGYATAVSALWAPESLAKSALALLALVVGALLTEEMGLAVDYVNGYVVGRGQYSSWGAVNGGTIPRGVDRRVSTILLAAAPLLQGTGFRIVGLLGCYVALGSLIASLGARTAISLARPPGVCSIGIGFKQCMLLGFTELGMTPRRASEAFVRASGACVLRCKTLFTAMLCAVVISMMVIVLVLTVSFLPLVIAAAVCAHVSRPLLPLPGVEEDYTRFQPSADGWCHWGRGVRVSAKYALVAGAPRQPGDVVSFESGARTNYSLGNADYLGTHIIGAIDYTHLAVKGIGWVAGTVGHLTSGSIHRHALYGCSTDSVRVHGTASTLDQVTLLLVADEQA